MTILRLTFLGTSAAQPTARRGLSGIAVRAHSDRFLVDCGEGSQRQMVRFGVGFRLDFVLFTHFHADHYLGIVGFLRTLSMAGHQAPLTLYGPAPGVMVLLRQLVHLGVGELSFPVAFEELGGGDLVARPGYRVRAVPVDHRTEALGYVLEEEPRPGVFDVERAGELGVPAGPLFGKLQRGEVVKLPDGRTLGPEAVLGPSRPGRRVAFSGDTRPCDALAGAAAGADLLVHESTFSRADQARAEETRHSTAHEAATVAERAGARRLALTHLSTRYDTRPEVLRDEAREAFSGEVFVAEDGLVTEIPLVEP